jgi:hypothetical protein
MISEVDKGKEAQASDEGARSGLPLVLPFLNEQNQW